MAHIQLTHDPILCSVAQLLILPVNNAGIILDPVINRCKTLYSDNYQIYRQQCLDGVLKEGSCLLVKHQQDHTGLSSNSIGNRVGYIANLVVSDHPYHQIRKRWLNDALMELKPKLYHGIRYDGLRHTALLARPLIYSYPDQPMNTHYHQNNIRADLQVPILDWQIDIYPLLCKHLQDLPKLRVNIHLPKEIKILE